MKFSGQSKDGVIDNLLRAYASRPGNPHQACPDFDPDQANAYIERSLTGASRLRYEAHLSECAGCRKTVVALVRLAGADLLTSPLPAREISRSTWLSTVKQAFSALTQPQWAMAAVAVIVLAIGLPLVLTRNESRQASNSVATPAAENQSRSAGAPAELAATPQTVDGALSADLNKREKGNEKPQLVARSTTSDSNTSMVPTEEAAVDKKKTETRGAEPVDEAQRKSESALAQAPAQGGAAPGSQVAKNDSDQKRQQQTEREKDAAQPATAAKAARSDSDSVDKDKEDKQKVARAEEVAQPPAPTSSEAAKDRGALRKQTAKLALRDSGPAESVRLYERKLSGKKFLLKDGAWTDKDFDPDKDLPAVTIIRDSNVYKELLGKRPGLKPFLTGFSASERAIIVYKGTVYRLIPQ